VLFIESCDKKSQKTQIAHKRFKRGKAELDVPFRHDLKAPLNYHDQGAYFKSNSELGLQTLAPGFAAAENSIDNQFYISLSQSISNPG
jgi:hypothetical protein